MSDLCDEYRLQPTVFYRWQKELFEKAPLVFESQRRSKRDMKGERIEQLQEKLNKKNEVLSELMEERPLAGIKRQLQMEN